MTGKYSSQTLKNKTLSLTPTPLAKTRQTLFFRLHGDARDTPALHQDGVGERAETFIPAILECIPCPSNVSRNCVETVNFHPHQIVLRYYCFLQGDVTGDPVDSRDFHNHQIATNLPRAVSVEVECEAVRGASTPSTPVRQVPTEVPWED